MLSVIAKITAKKEKTEEVRKLLKSLVTPTRAEEGCINYDLHEGISEKNVFFFYENWESQRYLEHHLANTHMVAFKSRSGPFLEKPMEVFLLEKI